MEFAGYVLNKERITTDPEKIDAVKKFPRPNNITQLKSFMGMVAQLADFSAKVASVAGPLRPLLRVGNPFT